MPFPKMILSVLAVTQRDMPYQKVQFSVHDMRLFDATFFKAFI